METEYQDFPTSRIKEFIACAKEQDVCTASVIVEFESNMKL